ncbi:hypothetical protein E2C01_038319 [Portunus trituberculatus]|uniref:Uncharacterized protein n=1 Tax=Portunus trituberculatus TaxID=210409 RepID=A0A5B7FDW1_PORTR|nr:hypothetical protein [Portunus trituberculatus]
MLYTRVPAGSCPHLVILVVNIGAVLDELPHDVYVSLAGGSLQRRVPALQSNTRELVTDYTSEVKRAS